MCKQNELYGDTPPAFQDLLHEIPELEAAIRKHADFLDIDWVENSNEDEKEGDITLH